MYYNIGQGIQASIHDELKERVMNHKQRFINIFRSRYLELLPTLISYKNQRATSIDFLKLEVALMGNYNIVIGEATNGKIMILGYAINTQTVSNPRELFTHNTLTKKDITFVVADHLIPEFMKEITLKDNASSGNFVIIRNKTLNYVTDFEIIDHYTEHLAEIIVSRFSLTMQTKIQTFFKGNENDETIPKLVSDLYNGAPYARVGKTFDEDESIVRIQNDNIAQNFKELKTEYQNVIGELHSSLGVPNLGVDKQSGVSETEAKSNDSATTLIANIKLDTRNDGFGLLNKRFGTKVEAIYNDRAASEFLDLEMLGVGEN